MFPANITDFADPSAIFRMSPVSTSGGPPLSVRLTGLKIIPSGDREKRNERSTDSADFVPTNAIVSSSCGCFARCLIFAIHATNPSNVNVIC